MLIPHPLPNEYVLGHLTRIRKINGLYSNEDALTFLLKVQNRTNHHMRDPVKLIAEALKIDEGQYRNHQTLKNFGFSAKYKLNRKYLPVWTNKDPLLEEAIHLPFRNHGYFCSTCTTASLAQHNFSIWDRRLQVPGINSCIEHGTPLLKSTFPYPFSHLPHELLNRSTPLDRCNEFKDEQQERYLRYIAISEEILNSKWKHIDETAYYSVLINEFRELKSEMIHKKLLTFLLMMYPSSWLKNDFPFISSPNPHRTLAKPQFPEEVLIALFFAAKYDQLTDGISAVRKVLIPDVEHCRGLELVKRPHRTHQY